MNCANCYYCQEYKGQDYKCWCSSYRGYYYPCEGFGCSRFVQR